MNQTSYANTRQRYSKYIQTEGKSSQQDPAINANINTNTNSITNTVTNAPLSSTASPMMIPTNNIPQTQYDLNSNSDDPNNNNNSLFMKNKKRVYTRASKACTACRRQKTRCFSTPHRIGCSRCSSLGKLCSFEEDAIGTRGTNQIPMNQIYGAGPLDSFVVDYGLDSNALQRQQQQQQQQQLTPPAPVGTTQHPQQQPIPPTPDQHAIAPRPLENKDDTSNSRSNSQVGTTIFPNGIIGITGGPSISSQISHNNSNSDTNSSKSLIGSNNQAPNRNRRNNSNPLYQGFHVSNYGNPQQGTPYESFSAFGPLNEGVLNRPLRMAGGMHLNYAIDNKLSSLQTNVDQVLSMLKNQQQQLANQQSQLQFQQKQIFEQQQQQQQQQKEQQKEQQQKQQQLLQHTTFLDKRHSREKEKDKEKEKEKEMEKEKKTDSKNKQDPITTPVFGTLIPLQEQAAMITSGLNNAIHSDNEDNDRSKDTTPTLRSILPME
ncbi:unnamed protein product [[Candida] boidinii]|nr:unnamed protein product [[Candida] boidinii]